MDHIWQADEYHQHSSVQHEAANQLLQRIKFRGDEHILDVGCGDGKITATITVLVPNGTVLGIDISQEMINFARNTFLKDLHSNLLFLIQDAQDVSYFEEFDIIFSSFALQWITDYPSFFKRIFKSLKPDGYLAATIPLGISEALDKAIDQTVSLQEWKPFFNKFSRLVMTTEKDFAQLLSAHRFSPIEFTVIIQTAFFQSREHFEKYVVQWFSYLNPIPKHLKELFFQQVINKYLEIEPILGNGKVRFKFPRLDVIASKVTL